MRRHLFTRNELNTVLLTQATLLVILLGYAFGAITVVNVDRQTYEPVEVAGIRG